VPTGSIGAIRRSGVVLALLVVCSATRAWAAVGIVQHATNSVSGVSTNTV